MQYTLWPKNKTIWQRLNVYLVGIALLFVTAPTQAAPQGIPAGWESYSDRPDILEVKAQDEKLGADWEKMKAAHLAFVAQLLEMYPTDTHFYFLARDSEYIYDLARLATEGTAESKRVHLLNISRANMHDENLKEYLSDNEITEEAIQAGKRIVFVDTGFSGTIPNVIGENFSEDSRSKLKTHLIVSSNENHPSSRTFLVHLNPLVGSQDPASMHGTIVNYEHMPRYTDRSEKFALINNVYHPISLKNAKSDGSVSKPKSLAFMSSLKQYWQKKETQAQYKAQRSRLKKLKSLLTNSNDEAILEIRQELESLANTEEGLLFEAQLRDAIEMQENASLDIKLTVKNLGLESINSKSFSKKNKLLKEHPEWASVLEDPDNQIPKLFKEQKWQMIGNLIDAQVDYEINELIAYSLYDTSATGIKKQYQILMIEKSSDEFLHFLVKDIFSGSNTKDMDYLIKRIIEVGDSEVHKNMANYVFSQPHTAKMEHLIKMLIDQNDPGVWQTIAYKVFKHPHAAKMTPLIKLLIEKDDEYTTSALIMGVLSNANTTNVLELLNLIIAKGDNRSLTEIAEYALNDEKMVLLPGLVSSLLAHPYIGIHRSLAKTSYYWPLTAETKKHIQILLDRDDHTTTSNLKGWLFGNKMTPKKQAIRDAIAVPERHTPRFGGKGGKKKKRRTCDAHLSQLTTSHPLSFSA